MRRTQRDKEDIQPREKERGQIVVLVLFVLGIFLLVTTALGVDFANFWFHRQAAQGAADAACTAGAMDMLGTANTGVTLGNFPGGNPFDCASASSAAPCRYAALNGYDGAGATPGNTVQVSFSPVSSVPGIDPDAISGLAPNLIQVDIVERVSTFFSGLLTGNRTQPIRVRARCAVLKAQSPVPLLVLNPICPSTLDVSGSGTVAIVGGPNRSVQVNSNSSTGASVTGSADVDLSKGGPAFTGSFMGVYGGPQPAPSGFDGGTTGGWSYPSSPISDPYQSLAPPTAVAALMSSLPTNPATQNVPYNTTPHFCPDTSGCTVYSPGIYTQPIVVKGKTALFVPGAYVFQIAASNFDKANCGTPGGCIPKPTGQCNYALTVDSNGVVRMSKATGDGSKGVTLYFSAASGSTTYGSAFFGSNAGSPGGRTIDPYDTTDATYGVKCPGGPSPDPNLNLPATISGNILLGPCTTNGTYIGASGESVGPVRGIMMFDDRANGDNHGQPSLQGGGGLLLAGALYFHNCPNSLTTGCNSATDYRAFFQLQGTPGSGTFLLGNITADEVILGGNGDISMQLDSARVFTILKATLIQ